MAVAGAGQSAAGTGYPNGGYTAGDTGYAAGGVEYDYGSEEDEDMLRPTQHTDDEPPYGGR